MNGLYGKCVLVVDDDPAMLRALTRVLRAEGAAVSQATRVEEALRHLAVRPGRFDLILADLCMPDVGSKSILEAVTLASPAVPIIIITAFGSAELRADCLLQGAAAFLEKPVDAATLLAAIQRVFWLVGKGAQPAVRNTEDA